MPYLTVKESAQIANRNERTIRRWIKAGKVKSTEIKGKYHVEEESLEKFIGKKVTADTTKSITNDQSKSKSQDSMIKNRAGRTKEELGRQDEGSENGVGHQAKSLGKKIKRKIIMSAVEQKTGTLGNMSMSRESVQDRIIALREGVEYEMSGQIEPMSENKQNNMSAKILSYSPIVSNSNIKHPGEMSDLSGFSMSDSRGDAISDVLQKTNTSLMSDYNGHLPTQSDGHVDKYFDPRGIIISETPFFPDKSDVSDKMSNYSDKFNGHLKRTFEMSAYATRLIEEKERVAKKFEEQNDFLKNELSELRKEISALREVVAQESKNRASTGDFLMESNRQLQQELLTTKTAPVPKKTETNQTRPKILEQNQPHQRKKVSLEDKDYDSSIGTYGFQVTYDDLLLKNFYYMLMGLMGMVVLGIIVIALLTFWT